MQHVKGVLVAAGIALLIVYLLSLFMASQLVLTKEIVINKNDDVVFNYVQNAENSPLWINDIKGVQLIDKGAGVYVFEGNDGGLYSFEFNIARNAKGLEISYFDGEDKEALFIIKCKSYGEQTVVQVVQYWNLGMNPFTKLLAYKTKEQSEGRLEDDLITLKNTLEEE